MSYACFELDVSEGVAHLRLNRPETMNALIPAFWSEFPAAVRDLDGGGKARAIVISAMGKHFCAGMDLSVFSDDAKPAFASDGEGERGRQREFFRAHVLHLQRAFSSLEEARLPVIAAVQGGCVGGGLDLVSACDIRYATTSAFFCIQEVNIGLMADLGTFPRLCQLIPQGWVRELAYTGRRLPAEKAHAIGLVNEVFATPEEMVVAALATAREIAERSPLAVHGSKHMINYARDHSIADSLEAVATWSAAMFHGGDLRETMKAREDKRAPRFEDLSTRPE